MEFKLVVSSATGRLEQIKLVKRKASQHQVCEKPDVEVLFAYSVHFIA